MSIKEQLTKHSRAVVVAPAGCGKTEMIVDAVALCESGRQLVLTHTNAGVDSLSKRFIRKGVSISKYKLQTIASFAIEYAYAFPYTSKVPNKEDVNNKQYYSEVYDSTVKVLNVSFVKTIVKASYSGIFVDEYQDCNIKQHEVVKALAEILPCRVLGDPLQGIFDFGGNDLVDWDRDVYTYFECLGELKEPWRWKKSNLELGNWIMQTRTKLENNQLIDFMKLPDSVVWVLNDDKNINQRNSCFDAKRKKIGSCVAIHNIPARAHSLARQLGGLFCSDEEVEGKELLKICKAITDSRGQQSSLLIYNFACCCTTGVKNRLNTIISKIKREDYDMKRISKFSDIAELLLNIIKISSYKNYYDFLCGIEKHKEFKIFRKELWCEFKRVLKYCQNNEGKSLIEVARKFRSVGDFNKRYDYENIISRVLLIKGLEYDQAIVLDADELTKKEFYVAISRPKKRLVILSRNKTLSFK
jgi:DNA helicase-2/ATP-dependent DNA helicase PcrA